MREWEKLASERLSDLVRLPTVATEAAFDGAYPDWKLTRAETFAQASAYFYRWLVGFANEVSAQEVVIDGQPLHNIWARIPGRDSSRAVLLEGHYDVVALDGNFAPRMSADGRVLGRGTCDMKGGLVTALLALEGMVLAGRRPRVDTYVLLTCEEEVEARAIQEFLRQKPDWCDRLEFAICLEPCFQDDEFQICTRHPGIACLEVGMALPREVEAKHWLDVRIETGETTPHASREPVYLDPNYAMLRVLKRLPEHLVALIESDRPIEKEANALSSYSHALVNAEIGEAALSDICQREMQAAIEGLVDAGRREAARDKCGLSIRPVTESHPALDVGKFARVLLALKAQATDTRYTNALYGRTPLTFAILKVRDGVAQAKIDLRPDDHLGEELESLIAQDEFAHCTIKTKWNDPGLEQLGIEDNPSYQRFFDCCQRVFPKTVPTPHAGWTEAAFMSKSLGVPVVVGGPGELHLTHKREESIDLGQMRIVYTILRQFLA